MFKHSVALCNTSNHSKPAKPNSKIHVFNYLQKLKVDFLN